MGNTNVRGVPGAEVGGQAVDSVGQRPSQSIGTNIPERRPRVPGQRASGFHQDGDVGPLSHVGSSDSMGQSPSDSPGNSARSPMMFTPQIPVVPILKADHTVVGPYPPWMLNSQGYNQRQEEHGIPTLIQWNLDGNEVFIEGSWDNWSTRIPLQKAGKDFLLVKLLPSGVYQYRFIVNGKRRYAPDAPWIYDEMGNANNVLDVHDYVPENLESIAGFEPPQSPEMSYNNSFPGPEDFGKEPPVVPPHLHMTLLNVPPNVDTPGSLLCPQHVILNHLYVEKGKSMHSVPAIGLTSRFRSKYVTVVLYKPLHK
eukprot:c17448_g1_i2 orf=359-1291(+)